VFLGDRDVFGEEILMTGAPQPIRVVFSARGGMVKGNVRDGADATILVLPNEDYLLSPGFIRITKCNPNGTFVAEHIRPGHYTVVALDRYERDALEDIAFVTRLRSLGTSITVSDGESVMLDLSVTAWPDL
jgi:hypothetical protein